MTDEQKTKALAIFAHYGEQSQVRQTIEECAELIQALAKLERKKATGKPATVEYVELLGEVADVMIMTAQIATMFDDKALSVMIDSKLDRQLDRIAQEAYNEETT